MNVRIPSLQRILATEQPDGQYQVTGQDLARLVAEASAAAIPWRETVACRYCLAAFVRELPSAEDFCPRCLRDRTPQEREAGRFFTAIVLDLMRAKLPVTLAAIRRRANYHDTAGNLREKSHRTVRHWWAAAEKRLSAGMADRQSAIPPEK